MNHDKPDCVENCSLAAYCAERNQCAVPPAPLSLAETLARFEREATPGVCQTGRYAAQYWSWGQGPPLLFVAGLGGSNRTFVPVAALLASRFRCIAYDYPDGPALARSSHADLVADVFALLDHLGLPRSYICGTSFGSTITLAALAAQPERLPRAILVSGFARRPLRLLERWIGRSAGWLPGTMRWLPLFRWVLRRHHAGPFAGRPPECWQYFENLAGSAGIRTMARLGRMIDQLDVRPLLPRVRQPVLLIDGDLDPLVDRRCSEELRAGLPNVRQVELVGCGHLAMFSHSEPLAALVSDFLTPPPA